MPKKRERPALFAVVSDVHAGMDVLRGDWLASAIQRLNGVSEFKISRFLWAAMRSTLAVLKKRPRLFGLADKERDNARENGSQFIPGADVPNVLSAVPCRFTWLLTYHVAASGHASTELQQAHVCVRNSHVGVDLLRAKSGHAERSLAIKQPREVGQFRVIPGYFRRRLKVGAPRAHKPSAFWTAPRAFLRAKLMLSRRLPAAHRSSVALKGLAAVVATQFHPVSARIAVTGRGAVGALSSALHAVSMQCGIAKKRLSAAQANQFSLSGHSATI